LFIFSKRYKDLAIVGLKTREHMIGQTLVEKRYHHHKHRSKLNTFNTIVSEEVAATVDRYQSKF
jgi:hypothetical protein